jgi:hypothetical protein
MTDIHNEAAAMIGKGCRPSGDVTPREPFWDLYVSVLSGRNGIIEVPENRQKPAPSTPVFSEKVAPMNGETLSRDAPCLADLTNLEGEST